MSESPSENSSSSWSLYFGSHSTSRASESNSIFYDSASVRWSLDSDSESKSRWSESGSRSVSTCLTGSFCYMAIVKTNTYAAAYVGCPGENEIMSSITFASYGLPTGDCSSQFGVTSCNYNKTYDIIVSHCLNQKECTIPLSPSFFGGYHCPGQKIRALYVNGTCSCNSLSASRSGSHSESRESASASESHLSRSATASRHSESERSKSESLSSLCAPGSFCYMAITKINTYANAYIRCPDDDQIMSSITFASYGLPTGDCSSQFGVTSCNYNKTYDIIVSHCLNQKECIIPLSPSFFGGYHCPGQKIRALYVNGTCSCNALSASRSGSHSESHESASGSESHLSRSLTASHHSESASVSASACGPTSLCIFSESSSTTRFYANMTCPHGGVISSIGFASYGAPTGDCYVDGLSANPSCNAPDSMAVVSAACLGMSSCLIRIRPSTFNFAGQACVKSSQGFAMNATCTCGPVARRRQGKVAMTLRDADSFSLKTLQSSASGPKRAVWSTPWFITAGILVVATMSITSFVLVLKGCRPR